MAKKHITRRDFLRATALTATGGLLAACAQPTPQVIEKVVTQQVEKVVEKEKVVTQQVEKVVEKEKVVTPTAAPVKEQVTIRFQEMGGRWQGWVEQLALPQFYEQYPWIKVEYEPQMEGWIDKNLTMMAAGTAPDIMHGWSDVFGKWVSKGQLLDLNPLVESDFTKEDRDDQIAFQWDTLVFPFTKERYAIPGYVDSQILYYNTEHFDEQGVKYPTADWTYDDYADASKKLVVTDKSGKQTRWGGWYWYGSWTFNSTRLNAWGGHYRDDETWMKCRLNEQPAKDAIEWVRARIFDDKSWINDTQVAAVGAKGDSAELFATGLFSIMEADIEFWPSMAKNVKFKWDIMHLPKGPAGRHALGDNDAWCAAKGVSKKGQNQIQAVWSFMKFLNSPTFQRLMVYNDGVVPARKSVNKEWPAMMRKQYPELEPVHLEVITDSFDMGHLTSSEQFRYQADAQPIIDAALQKLWQVGDAKVDILDQVATDVNKSQEDAAKNA